MKKYVIFICLIFLIIHVSFATDIASLYRDRQYDQIIQLFKDLPESQHNDESLYYLALSYLKMKDSANTEKTLFQLVRKDPSFYIYKIHYDLEFSSLFKDSNFEKKLNQFQNGMIWATRARKWHQIVEIDDSLFLYRNGIKIKLSTDGQVLDAGFVDDDFVYYVDSSSKKVINLHIFSAQQKSVVYTESVDDSFTKIQTKLFGQKLLMETSRGFLILDRNKWQSYMPYTQGQFVSHNPDRRMVLYNYKDTKSGRFEQGVLYY